MADIDLTAMTGDELDALWARVVAERGRRLTLATAAAQAELIADRYLDARDGAEPAETAEALADVGAWPAWVQPTGAHDANTKGRIVSHNGALWRSLIAANVWEPGSTGAGALWEKVTAGAAGEAPATPTAPAWDGGGHAYKAGDLVTYSGKTYRVLQAHSSQAGWTPTAAPSLWVAV